MSTGTLYVTLTDQRVLVVLGLNATIISSFYDDDDDDQAVNNRSSTPSHASIQLLSIGQQNPVILEESHHHAHL